MKKDKMNEDKMKNSKVELKAVKKEHAMYVEHLRFFSKLDATKFFAPYYYLKEVSELLGIPGKKLVMFAEYFGLFDDLRKVVRIARGAKAESKRGSILLFSSFGIVSLKKKLDERYKKEFKVLCQQTDIRHMDMEYTLLEEYIDMDIKVQKKIHKKNKGKVNYGKNDK